MPLSFAKCCLIKPASLLKEGFIKYFLCQITKIIAQMKHFTQTLL